MTTFGKRNPFSEKHLKPFEDLFGENPYDQSERKEGDWSFTEDDKVNSEDNDRWRVFTREYIEKDNSLDISWIKDKDAVDAEDLPAPEVLANEAMNELKGALQDIEELILQLGKAK